MLDAFIIDRIREEREKRQRSTQLPLYIERPEEQPSTPPRPRRRERSGPGRGSEIIDFKL